MEFIRYDIFYILMNRFNSLWKLICAHLTIVSTVNFNHNQQVTIVNKRFKFEDKPSFFSLSGCHISRYHVNGGTAPRQ